MRRRTDVEETLMTNTVPPNQANQISSKIQCCFQLGLYSFLKLKNFESVYSVRFQSHWDLPFFANEFS